jgi:hypothetical protein
MPMIVPAVLLIPTLFILAISVAMWRQDPKDAVVFALLGIVGGYGFLGVLARQLDVSDDGLHWRDEWTFRRRHLSWDQVVTVEFQRVSGFLQPQLLVHRLAGAPVAIALPYVSRTRIDEAVKMANTFLNRKNT